MMKEVRPIKRGLLAAVVAVMALGLSMWWADTRSKAEAVTREKEGEAVDREKEGEAIRAEARKQGIEFPDGWAFVPVKAGSFTMGSPLDETGRDGDEGAHHVTLTRTFWMSTTETTQAQYEEIMGTSSSRFAGPRRPVEQVSWYDAQDFVGKLNQRERQASRLPAGWEYRLPTEAEWEYACRAGSQTVFCFGNDAESLSDYAWFEANSANQTHDVAGKRPNRWGLHDMHGNVWEWCQDWYGEYTTGKQADPTGAAGGSFPVLRGGSWNFSSGLCRSANRNWDSPSGRDSLLGFRLVMAMR